MFLHTRRQGNQGEIAGERLTIRLFIMRSFARNFDCRADVFFVVYRVEGAIDRKYLADQCQHAGPYPLRQATKKVRMINEHRSWCAEQYILSIIQLSAPWAEAEAEAAYQPAPTCG
jgi:hypothetical protein